MPGYDRTGPEGQGSKTGRGLGRCNPNNKSEDQAANEEFPRGFGMRRGRKLGRGFRHERGHGLGRGLGKGNAQT